MLVLNISFWEKMALKCIPGLFMWVLFSSFNEQVHSEMLV